MVLLAGHVPGHAGPAFTTPLAATHYIMLLVYEKNHECDILKIHPKVIHNHTLFSFPSQEQYQTVFEAVLTYLDSFDTYANFQNL